MNRWMSTAAAGAIAGGLAAVAFLLIHAFVVVPLWEGIVSGIAVAMLVGAIISCGFEIVRVRAVRLEDAVLLGALLWSALLPATFVSAMLHDRVHEPIEIALGIATTVLYGAAIGAFFGGRRFSAAAAGAVIALAMLFKAGGPLTHFQSRRAILMFAGLLPVTTVYAMAVVAALRVTRPAG